MNRELYDAWCAALRFGKYRQGQSFLRQEGEDGDEWCCLGVLWDISGGEWGERGSDGEYYTDDEIVSGSGFLPERILDRRIQEQLAQRNDGEHDGTAWKFDQIAEWIEAHVEIDG